MSVNASSLWSKSEEQQSFKKFSLSSSTNISFFQLTLSSMFEIEHSVKFEQKESLLYIEGLIAKSRKNWLQEHSFKRKKGFLLKL